MKNAKEWGSMTMTEKENYARQQLVSLEWLNTDSGAECVVIPYNIKLIQDYVLRHCGGIWNETSLELAYQKTKHKQLKSEPEAEVTPVEPEPPKILTPEEKYGPYISLTREQVLNMPATTMRKFSGDPRYQAKILDLKITKNDLHGRNNECAD
jgi:hypothetical protein